MNKINKKAKWEEKYEKYKAGELEKRRKYLQVKSWGNTLNVEEKKEYESLTKVHENWEQIETNIQNLLEYRNIIMKKIEEIDNEYKIRKDCIDAERRKEEIEKEIKEKEKEYKKIIQALKDKNISEKEKENLKTKQNKVNEEIEGKHKEWSEKQKLLTNASGGRKLKSKKDEELKSDKEKWENEVEKVDIVAGNLLKGVSWEYIRKILYKKEKPEAEKPEAEKPETEKPETEKPEAEKPETEKPETEKPEAEKPETEKPEAEKPETEKPEVEKPETDKINPPVININDFEKSEKERQAREKKEADDNLNKKLKPLSHFIEKHPKIAKFIETVKNFMSKIRGKSNKNLKPKEKQNDQLVKTQRPKAKDEDKELIYSSPRQPIDPGEVFLSSKEKKASDLTPNYNVEQVQKGIEEQMKEATAERGKEEKLNEEESLQPPLIEEIANKGIKRVREEEKAKTRAEILKNNPETSKAYQKLKERAEGEGMEI